ncbi:hypothetical protein ES703_90965 [subsurface metagenome]
MADNELSQEVKEQLEIARSKVRRRLSYGAGRLGLLLTFRFPYPQDTSPPALITTFPLISMTPT